MSANPQAMAQMLAAGLGPQPSGQGSPMGAGAELAQKLMLMRALQQGQPQNPMMPPGMPQSQGPNAMPMPGGVNA